MLKWCDYDLSTSELPKDTLQRIANYIGDKLEQYYGDDYWIKDHRFLEGSERHRKLLEILEKLNLREMFVSRGIDWEEADLEQSELLLLDPIYGPDEPDDYENPIRETKQRRRRATSFKCVRKCKSCGGGWAVDGPIYHDLTRFPTFCDIYLDPLLGLIYINESTSSLIQQAKLTGLTFERVRDRFGKDKERPNYYWIQGQNIMPPMTQTQAPVLDYPLVHRCKRCKRTVLTNGGSEPQYLRKDLAGIPINDFNATWEFSNIGTKINARHLIVTQSVYRLFRDRLKEKNRECISWSVVTLV